MSIIIGSTSSPVRTAPVARAASESEAAVETPKPAQISVSLNLSDYAKKRMAGMREATAKLRAMQAQQQESRKAAARQRLEDIKKRIEMLKQLVAGLGPEAAKGALRQIKQLAQELGQAAAVLKEPSVGTPSSATPESSEGAPEEAVAGDTVVPVEAAAEVQEVVDGDPEASAAAAMQGVVEDASDAEGDERAQSETQQAREERDERQRQADGEELKKVARQLKQLLAMVKAQLNAKPDEDTKKLLGDIDKQLADTEKAATAMSGGGLSVSVSVGATLSITV